MDCLDIELLECKSILPCATCHLPTLATPDTIPRIQIKVAFSIRPLGIRLLLDLLYLPD